MTPFQHDMYSNMDYGVDTRGTDTVSKTPTQVYKHHVDNAFLLFFRAQAQGCF